MKVLFVIATLLISTLAFANEDNTWWCLIEANAIRGTYSLSPEEVGVLCNGAETQRSPVICYNEVVKAKGIRKPALAAVICSAAQPKGSGKNAYSPLACYRKAINSMGKSNKEAAATICSRAVNYDPLNCARTVKERRDFKDWSGAAAFCTQGFIARVD